MFKWGVTFHTLLVTRWNSLVACYSLQNHSLLVAKFARYSLQKLLVAKNHSLLVAKFARCKNHSLPVAKFARYSLEKLLVAKNHSLLVAKFACYLLQKLLIAKSQSLLVAEVARCKKLLITRYEKNSGTNIYLKPIKIGEFYLFFLFSWLKTEKDSVHNKVSIGKI